MTERKNIITNTKWLNVLDHYRKTGGILFCLGGVDTGKSTFIRWLANELVKAGKSTAIVDCDMGQSDIGPPATIGMAVINAPFSRFRELTADDIYYMGGIQPTGQLMQCLTGVVRMVQRAGQMAASHILVNTTGWIDGYAIFYKHAKMDALLPSVIVAMENKRELRHITAAYKMMNPLKIFYLKPSPAIVKRDTEHRRSLRKQSFENYFANAATLDFDGGKTGISGIRPPLIWGKISRQLVALVDSDGRHAALGKIMDFDDRRKIIRIHTPYKSAIEQIKRIHFENFGYGEWLFE